MLEMHTGFLVVNSTRLCFVKTKNQLVSVGAEVKLPTWTSPEDSENSFVAMQPESTTTFKRKSLSKNLRQPEKGCMKKARLKFGMQV